MLLLVVSETGLVYTFTTPKLQPLVTKPEGKNLIQVRSSALLAYLMTDGRLTRFPGMLKCTRARPRRGEWPGRGIRRRLSRRRQQPSPDPGSTSQHASRQRGHATALHDPGATAAHRISVHAVAVARCWRPISHASAGKNAASTSAVGLMAEEKKTENTGREGVGERRKEVDESNEICNDDVFLFLTRTRRSRNFCPRFRLKSPPDRARGKSRVGFRMKNRSESVSEMKSAAAGLLACLLACLLLLPTITFAGH